MTCSDHKETTMVLQVDLGCRQCCRKVKKTLCKFPQIRNQVYDEKNNMVIITVLCCSPERIMDKLYSKAGKSIKGIEMKPTNKPDKPQPAPAPAQTDKPKPVPVPAQTDKPKPDPAPTPAQTDKPTPVPAPAQIEKLKPAPAPAQTDTPKPKPAPQTPAAAPVPQEKPAEPLKKNGSKNGSKKGSKPDPPADAPPKPAKQAEPMPASKAMQPEAEGQWVAGYPPGPQPQMLPLPVSAMCYGGPYYQSGYGPQPGYGYQYGHPAYPQYPPGYYGNGCEYVSEENPSICSIM